MGTTASQLPPPFLLWVEKGPLPAPSGSYSTQLALPLSTAVFTANCCYLVQIGASPRFKPPSSCFLSAPLYSLSNYTFWRNCLKSSCSLLLPLGFAPLPLISWLAPRGLCSSTLNLTFLYYLNPWVIVFLKRSSLLCFVNARLSWKSLEQGHFCRYLLEVLWLLCNGNWQEANVQPRQKLQQAYAWAQGKQRDAKRVLSEGNWTGIFTWCSSPLALGTSVCTCPP